jgi:hypothetical protein
LISILALALGLLARYRGEERMDLFFALELLSRVARTKARIEIKIKIEVKLDFRTFLELF